MNITFLIGNGFDIGLGLASSFKDFFPIYFAKSLRKDPRIKQLSEHISDDEDTWSYFERQMGQYTAEFNIESARDFIDQLNDFTSEFMSYMRSQEERLSFSSERSISATMQKALTDFFAPSVLPVGSAIQIASIFERSASEEHKYHFVSFNYTDALQNCLKTINNGVVATRQYGSVARKDTLGKLVHVHGTIAQFPIMGVNDTSQIANQSLATSSSFADRLIKPQINRRLRMNFDAQAKEVINSSKILCIYGMSLGSTDRDWWDHVIKWLYGDTSRQLIVFLHDPQYNPSIPQNWIDKEDEIINLFVQYCKNPSIAVDKLRNRIHIAINQNLFSTNLTEESDKVYADALSRHQLI